MNVFNFGLRLKHNVKIVNAVSSFRMHLCIWHAFQNVCAPCYSGWHSRNHSRSTFKSRPGHLFPAAHWALPILALCSGRILSRALESAPALALWTGPVWAWSVSAASCNRGQQNRPTRSSRELEDFEESCYSESHSRVSSNRAQHWRTHSSS